MSGFLLLATLAVHLEIPSKKKSIQIKSRSMQGNKFSFTLQLKVLYNGSKGAY